MRKISGRFGAVVGATALMGMLAAAIAAPAQTYSVIASFGAGKTGSDPFAALIGDPAGNLYGTTPNGGAYGYGTVYSLKPTESAVLYSFTGGADGANPLAALLRDGGNLYGTADAGGIIGGPCPFVFGCGVVFKLQSPQAETVLHAFTGGADGARPTATLVSDNKGNLYGTTANGGHFTGLCAFYGCGVVFALDAAGNETVLHTFAGGPDGAFPAGVVRDSFGNLYGTAEQGGVTGACGGSGCGVVFKLDPTGNETVLHTFTGGTDGAFPNASLILDGLGNLYGITVNGGDLTCIVGAQPGCGVVFELDPTGSETVLYTFTGGADGAFPSSGVVRDPRGNLYGTTSEGGAYGFGSIFKLSAGTEVVLYSFTGRGDGGNPFAGLLPYKGYLYGTTSGGGAYLSGVAFQLSLP